MRTTTRPGPLLPIGLAAGALVLAACGGGGFEDDDASAAASGDAPAGGELTVGGANFTEMLILQELYAGLLTDAGYDVEIVSADNREIYAEALISGDIDVVPEYAATFAEYLNVRVNGADAPAIATADAADTVSAATPLAEGLGLVIGTPAEAVDQNGFAVGAEFAEANGLSTLSDLAALGQPIRLAAVEECPERPFCQPGLEATYGLIISEVQPLGFGSPQAKQAVADGQADLVLTGTTDATLEDFGLVLLADDKGLQLADNLVPVLNADTAQDPAVVAALDELAAVLTTEDLTELNRQVDSERLEAADVAHDYLSAEGLIG